uniref:Uncharacterized protein n=1 Tax=Rhodnius prolixus TaxID=13249 RepID=T1I1J6_RHOPR
MASQLRKIFRSNTLVLYFVFGSVYSKNVIFPFFEQCLSGLVSDMRTLRPTTKLGVVDGGLKDYPSITQCHRHRMLIGSSQQNGSKKQLEFNK